MKNTIFASLIAAFVFTSPNIASSFDITGWWKAEKKSLDMPTVLRITDTHLAGGTYKITKEDDKVIEIISSENITGKIIDNGNDTIIIRIDRQNTPFGQYGGVEFLYTLISHDLSLSRKEAKKLSGVEE